MEGKESLPERKIATDTAADLSAQQTFRRRRVFAAIYFSYIGYYITRKGYGVLKKPIGDAFQLDAAALAHIWTAFLLAYMIGQFISGLLGRKWGPRVLLLTGMAISLGCNVAFGFTNSYATLIGFMILNGLAQSSGWPGIIGTVAFWLRPQERGTIMGLLSTNYVVGNIAVKLLVSLVWTWAGWRTAFWACSLVMAAIWLLVFYWQRNQPEDEGLPAITDSEKFPKDPLRHRSVSLSDILRFACKPVILVMGVTYFSIKFLRYALDSWLPYFLATGKSAVNVATAGYYSTIFDWAGLVGALLAGWLLDRFFRGRWQLLCFLLTMGMVLSYGLVLRFGGISPLLMASLYGLVGFLLYGPDSLIAGAAAIEEAGEKNAILASGMINGIASLGPVIQEEVIGRLYAGSQDVQIINQLYFVISAIAAILLLYLMIMQKRKLRHHDLK